MTMGNQKGEVVAGVMVVMMVVMMLFGMSMMHGGHKDHGDSHDHGKNEQKKHDHADMGPNHMNHDHGDPENSTKSGTVETK
jgi:ABC-type Zn2+ transport system substrate-binding protein/surface adhesin